MAPNNVFAVLYKRFSPARAPAETGWPPPGACTVIFLIRVALAPSVAFPAPDVARGPVRELTLDAPCPVCSHAPLVLRSLDLDLPYFGEALQTTVLCRACGYRHGDLMLTRHREPVRVILYVTGSSHRSARVARSSSGTVRIPELGASMEPGPRAEAFVTNVEGVLRKFLDVVQGQEAVATTSGERRRLAGVRARIEALIDGREPFTFILEDPTGNSDVIHGDVVREPLSREEAARLKTSETVLDLADLARSDEEE